MLCCTLILCLFRADNEELQDRFVKQLRVAGKAWWEENGRRSCAGRWEAESLEVMFPRVEEADDGGDATREEGSDEGEQGAPSFVAGRRTPVTCS